VMDNIGLGFDAHAHIPENRGYNASYGHPQLEDVAGRWLCLLSSDRSF